MSIYMRTRSHERLGDTVEESVPPLPSSPSTLPDSTQNGQSGSSLASAALTSPGSSAEAKTPFELGTFLYNGPQVIKRGFQFMVNIVSVVSDKGIIEEPSSEDSSINEGAMASQIEGGVAVAGSVAGRSDTVDQATDERTANPFANAIPAVLVRSAASYTLDRRTPDNLTQFVADYELAELPESVRTSRGGKDKRVSINKARKSRKGKTVGGVRSGRHAASTGSPTTSHVSPQHLSPVTTADTRRSGHSSSDHNRFSASPAPNSDSSHDVSDTIGPLFYAKHGEKGVSIVVSQDMLKELHQAFTGIKTEAWHIVPDGQVMMAASENSRVKADERRIGASTKSDPLKKPALSMAGVEGADNQARIASVLAVCDLKNRTFAINLHSSEPQQEVPQTGQLFSGPISIANYLLTLPWLFKRPKHPDTALLQYPIDDTGKRPPAAKWAGADSARGILPDAQTWSHIDHGTQHCGEVDSVEAAVSFSGLSIGENDGGSDVVNPGPASGVDLMEIGTEQLDRDVIPSTSFTPDASINAPRHVELPVSASRAKSPHASASNFQQHAGDALEVHATLPERPSINLVEPSPKVAGQPLPSLDAPEEPCNPETVASMNIKHAASNPPPKPARGAVSERKRDGVLTDDDMRKDTELLRGIADRLRLHCRRTLKTKDGKKNTGVEVEDAETDEKTLETDTKGSNVETQRVNAGGTKTNELEQPKYSYYFTIQQDVNGMDDWREVKVRRKTVLVYVQLYSQMHAERRPAGLINNWNLSQIFLLQPDGSIKISTLVGNPHRVGTTGGVSMSLLEALVILPLVENRAASPSSAGRNSWICAASSDGRTSSNTAANDKIPNDIWIKFELIKEEQQRKARETRAARSAGQGEPRSKDGDGDGGSESDKRGGGGDTAERGSDEHLGEHHPAQNPEGGGVDGATRWGGHAGNQHSASVLSDNKRRGLWNGDEGDTNDSDCGGTDVSTPVSDGCLSLDSFDCVFYPDGCNQSPDDYYSPLHKPAVQLQSHRDERKLVSNDETEFGSASAFLRDGTTPSKTYQWMSRPWRPVLGRSQSTVHNPTFLNLVPFANGLANPGDICVRDPPADGAPRGLVWTVYRGIMAVDPLFLGLSSSAPFANTQRLLPGQVLQPRARNVSSGSSSSGTSTSSSAFSIDLGSNGPTKDNPSIRAHPIVHLKVVIKHCNVRGLLVGQENLDRHYFHSAIGRELEMYTGPLNALQGTVVPRLLGAWKNGDDFVTVLEDVGESLGANHIRAWVDMERGDRLAILGLFNTLHNSGIAHNDVQPWHVAARHDRVTGQRLFRIIDFDRAMAFEGEADGEAVAVLNAENDSVRKMLAL